MHWIRCDHKSVLKPSLTEWRVMCTFSEKSRYLCMFKKAHTKTPSTEGKWYESGARFAVFGEVISRLSHFKTQASSCYRLDLNREWLLCLVVQKKCWCWLVSHMRRQRLRHKPPHAHTAVYHSFPTIWSALKGSLLKCSLSLFALIQVCLISVCLSPSVHSIQFDARKPHQSNSYSTSSFNLEWSCHQDWHHHLLRHSPHSVHHI